MPMLNELRRQLASQTQEEFSGLECDEILVSDVRNGMRSTQIIDQKFGDALSREFDRSESFALEDESGAYQGLER